MEFYEAVRRRVSVRAYRPDPVPEEVLNRILEAGRLAPSAKNYQPWKFIVIRDEKVKEELVPACRNQAFIAQAPVIICGCALLDQAWKGMGGYWSAAEVDVTIALEHIILAAAAEGLGTCWIGAFKEEDVRRVLGIPEGVKPVALTPVGYPSQETTPRPRKSLSEIVCFDRYQ